MAKKPNEPLKQYISVANNSEIYKLGKALTTKDFFSSIEGQDPSAEISDSKKNIIMQITEYDVVKKPSLLMKATKKEEIVNKVTERLESLDQNTRDVYLILFTHWMKNKIGEGLEDEGKAFIELDSIHFDYRGLRGKNLTSSMDAPTYTNYIQAIDTLSATKVKIDITKETNVAYEKIKSLKWGAVEGFLINNLRLIWNDKKSKVIGLFYDLGLIGEAYTQHVPQINNKYPTAILQLDSKNYATAKDIGNYLCFLHRCNENANNKKTILGLYSLMMEVRFEVQSRYAQRCIDRFLKHLTKIEDVLIKNGIVRSIKIPTDIHSKNYKTQQIEVNWFY